MGLCIGADSQILHGPFSCHKCGKDKVSSVKVKA
jgi:transcription elongation factor Elf1